MKSWIRTEDTLAVLLGLGVLALSLPGVAGYDLLGWAASVKIWVDPALAVAPASKGYAAITGPGSVAATFGFLLAVLCAGMAFIGASPGKFAVRFTVLFALAFGCWVGGHYAYVAATPDKLPKGVEWSLGLTNEAGYLFALLGGLVIANFLPAFGAWLKDAGRSELYIKAAIIIIGASLGAKAADESSKTQAILFRGLAAIIEAYLVYWAFVYLVARKFFGFSREWAAPLASGISICGVSAAITTGAAIRARPVVPVMVSSLVVIFSVIEMLILPQLARALLANEPMVAAAWMGLAVKTDGAAISTGTLTAGLFFPGSEGAASREAMILTTTTVKVFIDLFIGVWAVILAVIWTKVIDRRPGATVPWRDIWERFPKFVFGYVLTFGVCFAIGLASPASVAPMKVGSEHADVFRRLFFVLTFFSIGLAANFRRLWAEGLGRLALVYVVCLFGFVIWVGLGISWLFFHGVSPVSGKG
ncbi:putative sulfate exporter family transporter [Gemmata sp.]|uniref:putative sulfate exporter family transporter n=1 Tax=Gemmata sp. TaxID=1914242 RepID=UPI003F6EF9DD